MKIKADKDLCLIKIRLKSAAEIYDCVERSRDFLRQWLPFVDYTKSVQDTEKYIKSLQRQRNPKRDLLFEIRDHGNLSGLIALKDIDLANNKAEIGYWLDKESVGKGIMIRSCQTLIRYAFDELKLNKIQIKCAVENTRSCNIPKQLGFIFEGVERQGELIHGKYHDLKVYSLLKKEWNMNA